MDLLQRHNDGSRQEHIRVVCGWCGRLLRECANTDAPTSHGMCGRCAGVLEGQMGDQNHGSDNLRLSALEEHTNQLMCGLYESSQMLLDIQKRVRDDAELLARVGQALASIRRQERAVADIQRWISSSQG